MLQTALRELDRRENEQARGEATEEPQRRRTNETPLAKAAARMAEIRAREKEEKRRARLARNAPHTYRSGAGTGDSDWRLMRINSPCRDEDRGGEQSAFGENRNTDGGTQTATSNSNKRWQLRKCPTLARAQWGGCEGADRCEHGMIHQQWFHGHTRPQPFVEPQMVRTLNPCELLRC
jgi:hypothetical protein